MRTIATDQMVVEVTLVGRRCRRILFDPDGVWPFRVVAARPEVGPSGKRNLYLSLIDGRGNTDARYFGELEFQPIDVESTT